MFQDHSISLLNLILQVGDLDCQILDWAPLDNPFLEINYHKVVLNTSLITLLKLFQEAFVDFLDLIFFKVENSIQSSDIVNLPLILLLAYR